MDCCKVVNQADVPANKDWYMPNLDTAKHYKRTLRSYLPDKYSRASFYGGYIQGRQYKPTIVEAEEGNPMQYVAVPNQIPDKVMLIRADGSYAYGDFRVPPDSFAVIKFPGLKDANDEAFFFENW